jgi:hypothetical protein
MLQRLFSGTANGSGNAGKPSSSFDACCGNRTKKVGKGDQPIEVRRNLVEGNDESGARLSASGLGDGSSPQKGDDDTADMVSFSNKGDKPLKSFEELNEPDIMETLSASEEGSNSDQEDIKSLGKALKDQSQRTQSFFKKIGRGDEAAMMNDATNHLKAEFGNRPTTAQMGTSHWRTPGRQSPTDIDHNLSSGSVEASMTRAPTGLSMGSASSHNLAVQRAVSSPRANMNVVTPTGISSAPSYSEDEEEDEPDETDAKYEEVLNRKYYQDICKTTPDGRPLPVDLQAGSSLRRGIESLRQKMEVQGIEEPPSESDEEKDEEIPTVLDLEFQCRMEENDELVLRNKTITFRKKPLGIKWEKRLPITISDVTEDGYAQELGVQVGWKLVMINRIKCETIKSYPKAHKALMHAVHKLPPAIKEVKRRLCPRAALDHTCNVTIGSAYGFDKTLYDREYLCVCELPGKPHSKVRTLRSTVSDLGDDFGIDWSQEFDLFDFALGDSIDIALVMKGASHEGRVGEDTTLGRATLSYHSFSHMLDHESRRAKKSKRRSRIIRFWQRSSNSYRLR